VASIETGAGDNQSHRIPILSTLAPHQQAMCTILDNMFAWVLNIYNTPFIDYVGEIDGSFSKQVLARQQLTREGFHFQGESFSTGLRVVEIPNAVFFVAPNTPHAMAPEMRKRMDAIHYENIRRGRQIPDHIRFLTYTTRYNRSYWVTLDGLAKHYERAEVDATRNADRTRYTITTRNLTRLVLREADRAASIDIDGQKVSVKAAPAIALEKSAGGWRQASLDEGPGLRKRHGIQGPSMTRFSSPSWWCALPARPGTRGQPAGVANSR